jgi:hypothetical protein
MSPSGGTGEETLDAVMHPDNAAPAAIPAVLRKFLLSEFMDSIPLCFRVTVCSISNLLRQQTTIFPLPELATTFCRRKPKDIVTSGISGNTS